MREDPCPEAQGPQLFCSPTQTRGGKQTPTAPLPRGFFSFYPFRRTCETDFFFSSKLYKTTLFFFCGVLETDFSRYPLGGQGCHRHCGEGEEGGNRRLLGLLGGKQNWGQPSLPSLPHSGSECGREGRGWKLSEARRQATTVSQTQGCAAPHINTEQMFPSWGPHVSAPSLYPGVPFL